MFRRLAQNVTNGAQDLVRLHPAELIGLLEMAWDLRMNQTTGTPVPEPGHPFHRSDIPGLAIPRAVLPGVVRHPPSTEATTQAGDPDVTKFTGQLQSLANPNDKLQGIQWDHIIYAFMVENTRIYEIFRRVVDELVSGEKLGIPSIDTQLWLRNTEELFFRDPPPISITTHNS